MSEPLYMDAVITPQRSLSRRGFIVVISVLTAINTATAVMFILLHAAPIPIFLGLAVIALAAGLIVSQRAARRAERIQVTAVEVRVTRDSAAGSEVVWVSPTAFTRLARADEEECALELRLSGRALSVGRALNRTERREFAAAFDQALYRARGGSLAI